LWHRRLSLYPKWKLVLLLKEYTGRFSNDVFAWLEDLSRRHEAPQPIERKQLPHQQNPEIGKRTIAHCLSMLSDKYTAEQKAQIERDFVELMRKDFPHVNWGYGTKINRGINS
jgi:hypothetical protein